MLDPVTVSGIGSQDKILNASFGLGGTGPILTLNTADQQEIIFQLDTYKNAAAVPEPSTPLQRVSLRGIIRRIL